MKKKRILSFLLSAILLLNHGTAALAGTKTDSAVKVKTKHFQKSDKYMLADLRIPVFCGIKDKKAEAKLNKEIESGLMENYMKLRKDAISFCKEAEKNKSLRFMKYEADSEFKLQYSGKNLVSVSVQTYEFTGGAHGSPGLTCYNIDKKTGKNLTLKNLFKEDGDYKTLLNEEIRAQIREKNSEGFFFESIGDQQQYYIKDGALNIVFQAYEIAPYALGQPTFAIPLTTVAHLLKNEIK